MAERACFVVGEGVWLKLRDAGRPAGGPRPGLILDRDGVLVEEVNYLSRIEDIRVIAGGAALVREAAARGIPVGVATNQSAIGRGVLDWAGFEAIEAEIERRLTAAGAALDAVAACAFHPEHTAGFSDAHAYWRKPGPGLIRLLGERLGLDLARSWMVGDKASDIAAARGAGLAGAVHVLTGYGASERGRAAALAGPGFEVLLADDPAGAGIVLDRILRPLL
ncbi:MAG: HAD-IIIA family hydrolase [Proteobacteria bacterium]|nr:HAD-IIIA family hydrolase [Pseudomonadota bacterium]